MQERTIVEYNKPIALPGAIAGTAIALGVPAITMIWGRYLPVGLQMLIILLGLGLGVLIALTSAFFGTVMPSSVNNARANKQERRPETSFVPAETIQ